ncbi:solute carrier family 15 member 2-like isoform X2 [Contarinia nasturtii]|uniref:solute carrier family 15 member 2-like isoform X2 n=1 Tax=Contarinia nasturtii TaxID=265458 RepID=UPI0012D495B6|nr:solute carrier family 15 member 2-like isoform X2 [Contarinia nasturtii]
MINSEEKTVNDTIKPCNGSKTLSNAEPEKYSYPKRVFLIFGSEFCERFNLYGFKIFHVFTAAMFSTTMFGGILSDVWLGKFNTILYLSLLYLMGSIIISIGAVPFIDFSPNIALMIGLVLIAIGAGGIKPCVAAFGADQFKMPEQAHQIAPYFSLFYFTMNAGASLSTVITPLLRANVHCFGDNDCYSLAFGVPAVLMIISIVFFVIGKSSYTHVKTSSENMIIRMYKCTKHAISARRREKGDKSHKNLLDYSIDKYGAEFIDDIRILLQILVLYLPFPIFHALLDQIGSRWSLQASNMNGDLGFYTIEPDQMQMLDALMCLTFVPLFDTILYPIMGKIGIRQPIHKIIIGGILIGCSFLLAAFLEFSIVRSPEHSINMLWQIPQYVILTLGEVMFSVTGLAFSYDQAPASMKSVVQAFWLLTIAFGNVVFVAVIKMKIVETQTFEFILFAALMFIALFILAILGNFNRNISQKANASNVHECESIETISIKK